MNAFKGNAGHRVAGTLIAADVLVGVFLLDRSLQNEQWLADVLGLLGHWVVEVAMVLVACATCCCA